MNAELWIIVGYYKKSNVLNLDLHTEPCFMSKIKWNEPTKRLNIVRFLRQNIDTAMMRVA